MPAFVELPQLKEPPLVEVLYGLQAITAPTIGREHVRAVLEPELPGFKLEDMDQVQVQVRTVEQGRHLHEQRAEWHGIKAISADGKRVAHFTREGLFISFLPPYGGFPECIEEVRRLWVLYTKCFAPQQVARLGIRYINRLLIPVEDGIIKFEDHFKLLTLYPVEGPFELHRFHNQFEVSSPEFGIPARVIFTSMKETRTGLEVILDIESFDDETRRPTDAIIWDRFDLARKWAYKLFSNTLTEKCFQQFQ